MYVDAVVWNNVVETVLKQGEYVPGMYPTI